MEPETTANSDPLGSAAKSEKGGLLPKNYENVNDLLQEFRKHPALFTGVSRDLMTLRLIKMFMSGYEWALAVHDIDEIGAGFERGFLRFLRTNYRWNERDNWLSLLALHIPNESEAVDRFFELADEYCQATKK